MQRLTRQGTRNREENGLAVPVGSTLVSWRPCKTTRGLFAAKTGGENSSYKKTRKIIGPWTTLEARTDWRQHAGAAPLLCWRLRRVNEEYLETAACREGRRRTQKHAHTPALRHRKPTIRGVIKILPEMGKYPRKFHHKIDLQIDSKHKCDTILSNKM